MNYAHRNELGHNVERHFIEEFTADVGLRALNCSRETGKIQPVLSARCGAQQQDLRSKPAIFDGP
ncbi:MAG: hypothetical protein ACREDM_14090 [Methylocella sp.]